MSSQQKQAQDEMTERLHLLYRQILIYSDFAVGNGLTGLDKDDLSLLKWALGITTKD